MSESNETLGTVSDWRRPASGGQGGGGKAYDIPFKAMMKGTLRVEAGSKKAAFAAARKILKQAGLKLDAVPGTLPAFVSKKQSIRTTKK